MLVQYGWQSSSVSERTKHVDLRAHFVRDMIKDQVIEIKFLQSAENDSDIFDTFLNLPKPRTSK